MAVPQSSIVPKVVKGSKGPFSAIDQRGCIF